MTKTNVISIRILYFKAFLLIPKQFLLTMYCAQIENVYYKLEKMHYLMFFKHVNSLLGYLFLNYNIKKKKNIVMFKTSYR